MTNNPTKVAALAQHDIEVVERVPHIYPSNKHNDGYLRTKAAKSGHMFEF
jgi:GTP cyclohydrolase II